MADRGLVVDAALGAPKVPLRPFVTRYVGYRYLGFRPGLHLGLPSRSLTVVIALGPPTRLTVMPNHRQAPGEFRTLASGLSPRAVGIGHDGDQFGVQLDLTPRGSRRLLGLPAGELGSLVVGLSDLLGKDADELLHRMASAETWPERFQLLDEILLRRTSHPLVSGVPAPLARAWAEVIDSGGAVRVEDLAYRVGWSRRHLSERFTREFGLGPKELARVVRFERSTHLLKTGRYRSLAEVATRCGFYDQAHLAREWGRLAGCPPSAWLASEDLPSVQAALDDAEDAAVS